MATANKLDLLRTVRFSPYRKGMGPTFTLKTWLAGTNQQPDRSIHGPRDMIGYSLTMKDNGKRVELFTGEDFSCSPMHAIDGDQCIKSLMSFLTLRPGDTDAEYFQDYTPEQLEYCSHHAEALSCEVMYRFGEG